MEESLAETIYENGYYKVIVGDSNMIEDYKVYKVINKRTGVAEVEDSMLPKIIDYAVQLNEAVDKIGDEGVVLFPESTVSH
jgi:hypothetical protein